MAEVFRHHEFAPELRDRHAPQRAAQSEVVPQFATGIRDHTDVGSAERVGDDREAAVGEHWARLEYVPRAERHGTRADAQHGTGSIAKNQRVRRVDCDPERGQTREKSHPCVVVRSAPARCPDLAISQPADLYARGCRIDDEQGSMGGNNLAETRHLRLTKRPATSPRKPAKARRIRH